MEEKALNEFNSTLRGVADEKKLQKLVNTKLPFGSIGARKQSLQIHCDPKFSTVTSHPVSTIVSPVNAKTKAKVTALLPKSLQVLR